MVSSPARSAWFRSAAGLLVAMPHVLGHGALIMPPSRNAIDRFLPEFGGGKFPKADDGENYGCNCGNMTGDGCTPGHRSTGKACNGGVTVE